MSDSFHLSSPPSLPATSGPRAKLGGTYCILSMEAMKKRTTENVRKQLLPAEHRVERVGDVVVSVFNHFFAQCYFYVRVTLWGRNRGQVMSLWGANLS